MIVIAEHIFLFQNGSIDIFVRSINVAYQTINWLMFNAKQKQTPNVAVSHISTQPDPLSLSSSGRQLESYLDFLIKQKMH